MVVFSPQIIENFRRGSADGLSLLFLIVWLAGDVFNILGAVMQGVLPTMTILAVYYTLADIVLLGQCFYYRGFNLKDEISPSSTPQLSTTDDEHSGTEDQPGPTERSTLLPKSSGNDHVQIQDAGSTSRHGQEARPISAGRRHSATSYHDIFHSSAHLSPATPFIEPPSNSAHERAQRLRRRRISALQSVLFNLTAVALVCAAGVLGWYVSPATKSSSEPESLTMDLFGQIFGYFCAVLYLGSRLPQLLLNYRRKSTDGVSLLFFLFACIGNLTYVLSILAYSPVCSDRSAEGITGHPRHHAECRPGEAAALYGRYVLVNLSWLVGSAGTLLLDMAIFTQFFLYRDPKRGADEE